MAASPWAHALPGVDSDTLARADEIEARKQQMRAVVEQCLADEAALFMELYHSRRWPPDVMSKAVIQRMEWPVVKHLPERLPPQRRRKE